MQTQQIETPIPFIDIKFDSNKNPIFYITQEAENLLKIMTTRKVFIPILKKDPFLFLNIFR